MSVSLADLTQIYDSKGMDGLSRSDREKLNSFNRKEFLFEKFLKIRNSRPKIQLTHEHILGKLL
jgi:hypothetical protein